MSLLQPPKETAKIAIIGGTGLYDPKLFRDSKDLKVFTPYGPTSPFLSIGLHGENKVAFIPRHGRDHSIPPHRVNYRANIYALKQIGVERIIGVSSVGSLKESLKPGDFTFPDQFIDRTKNRRDTFFEGGQVVHVSSADPFCPQLTRVFGDCAQKMGINFHEDSTYVCIEGPRFSSRSESQLFRLWGADVVGMTLYPECVLAREAQICYAAISMVTDYDVWSEKPVTAVEVSETMRRNVENAKRLILSSLDAMPEKRTCDCGKALSGAVL
jgi:5'-methylthioadenosine phosphorylase